MDKERIYRICVDCWTSFLVVDDTDGLCDKCSEKLLTGSPFSRSEKNVWDSKVIKKQWQKSAKETISKLSEQYKIVLSNSGKIDDPLLNKTIIIK